ncbi:UNVERIFIED_ORG: putative membrane protein [Clostridioides difficile F501]
MFPFLIIFLTCCGYSFIFPSIIKKVALTLYLFKVFIIWSVNLDGPSSIVMYAIFPELLLGPLLTSIDVLDTISVIVELDSFAFLLISFSFIFKELTRTPTTIKARHTTIALKSKYNFFLFIFFFLFLIVRPPILLYFYIYIFVVFYPKNLHYIYIDVELRQKVLLNF